ncbi:MAG: hypothetical protein K6A39_04170 [Clostridiales bacterium]|nr:hypothetical protein [Clostridiales bacterium]
MKNTKIKRLFTAAAAVVLVLSLSVTALAEGSDSETQPPEFPDQQTQDFTDQPGQVPDTQAIPVPGQGNGNGFGGKAGRGLRQGLNGQQTGGSNRFGASTDEISAAINALEDGEIKDHLNVLFDAWKTSLETEQAANSACAESEAALNEALKAAGLSVQAGRSGSMMPQSGFESGARGNTHAGMKGNRGMGFAEVRSAIDQVEDAETKAKLNALLDALTSALSKGKTPGDSNSSGDIASAEAALNAALAEAGISVKVGRPDAAPESEGTLPAETQVPSLEAAESGVTAEEDRAQDVSELLDIIRNWLKGASD